MKNNYHTTPSCRILHEIARLELHKSNCQITPPPFKKRIYYLFAVKIQATFMEKKDLFVLARKIICSLGADFKNNQTTKQLNNLIWTNRKQGKFCFHLPIGPNI